MKPSKNWVKILALSLSFPSTILALVFAAAKIVELGYLSKPVAFGICLLLITNILVMMVIYAIKNKN